MEDIRLIDGNGTIIANKDLGDVYLKNCTGVIIENCNITGNFYMEDCDLIRLRYVKVNTDTVSFLSSRVDIKHCNFYLTGNKPILISQSRRFSLINSYFEIAKAGLHVLETDGFEFTGNTIRLEGNIDTFALLSHSNNIEIQSNKFIDKLYFKNTAYRYQNCIDIRHGGDEIGTSQDIACIYDNSDKIIVEYNKFISASVCSKFISCTDLTIDGLVMDKANSFALELDNTTSVALRDCEVKWSRIAGVLIKNSKDLDLRGCKISNCNHMVIPKRPGSQYYETLGIDDFNSYTQGSAAVYTYNSDNLSMYNCEISESECGIIGHNVSNMTVVSNNIKDVHTGVVLIDTLSNNIKLNDIQSEYCGIIVVKDNLEVKSGRNELRSNTVSGGKVDIYCTLETDNNIIIDNDVQSIITIAKNDYYAQILLSEYELKIYLSRLGINRSNKDKDAVTTGNLVVLRNTDLYDEANVQARLLYKKVVEYLT